MDKVTEAVEADGAERDAASLGPAMVITPVESPTILLSRLQDLQPLNLHRVLGGKSILELQVDYFSAH